MKISLKGKSIIKKVALALAGVVAITAVGFGVKAIVDYTKNDLQTANLSYDVGNLGSDGKFVDDKGTLYTKDAFACYGLQVKPDFDSSVNYRIFYYDILDNYISATSVMSDGYSAEAPVNGAYARLVIEPKNDEDGKISLIEKVKYASQLTVKVKKNQDLNNRFNVFKGKVMQVVSDTDSLVFTNNLCFSHHTLLWEENNHYCVTSSTILKVEGGSTLKYDFSKLDEKYATAYCRVFQFKGLPLEDNMISKDSEYRATSPYVLDKQAKYLIISVDTNNSSVAWTNTELTRLSSLFSVTKTN